MAKPAMLLASVRGVYAAERAKPMMACMQSPKIMHHFGPRRSEMKMAPMRVPGR